MSACCTDKCYRGLVVYIVWHNNLSGLSLPQAGAAFCAVAVPKSISSRRLWLTVRTSFGLIDFDFPSTCSSGLVFCTNNAADFDRAACAPASAYATREEMAMKSNHKIAAAVIASFVLGAGAVSVLHAQAKIPAYVVAE